MHEKSFYYMPQKAFILAAGFGTRLRPYTDTCPKPMVQVAGRSLIARALEYLRLAGVKDVVVNTHYLADVLQAHLKDYLSGLSSGDLKIYFSHEDAILDTGGGVKKALQHFGDDPFFVIAGDGLWTESGESALHRLARHWNNEKMDILTLMQPLEHMKLTGGTGDFDLLPDGRVKRSQEKTGKYMWTNIRLNHPRIYKNCPEGAFSFLKIMDECEAQGRFFGMRHEGDWHHISTPRDLEAVDREFREKNL